MTVIPVTAAIEIAADILTYNGGLIWLELLVTTDPSECHHREFSEYREKFPWVGSIVMGFWQRNVFSIQIYIDRI